MNLGKLTIHNIASIEHAELDFGSNPLRDADLFLMCGTTGSGKTTILDAICLALYATSPRFKATRMQGATGEVDQDISVNDPRQVLRRGAGEGYVSLTFTGSNGRNYEATWSVQRAHKRPTGKLQGKKWILTAFAPDGHSFILAKDKEIAAEIKVAVGLDFAQFCRTSMLAQGEFTRFLNSTDDEKASILEKITGVDIYSAIGRKIYEHTSAKEHAWAEIRDAIGGIAILSEDEIAGARARIKSLEDERTATRATAESTTKKIQWLKDSTTIDDALNDARRVLAKADSILRDESTAETERTILLWESTVSIRNTRRDIMSAHATAEACHKDIESLKIRYSDLCGALKTATHRLDALTGEYTATTDALAEYAPYLEAIGNRQSIIGYLDRMTEDCRAIKAKRDKIRHDRDELSETLVPRHDDLIRIFRQKTDAVDDVAHDIGARENSLEALDIPGLRSALDRNIQVGALLRQAVNDLKALDEERERRRKDAEQIDTERTDLTSLEQKVPEIQVLVSTAKAKLETATDIRDRLLRTADKWTRHLRQHLAPGDECPVCGQPVEHPLPNEGTVDAMLNDAEQVYAAAASEYETRNSSLSQLAAEIAARRKALDLRIQQFEASDTLEGRTQRATESCIAVGITSIDDTTPKALEHLLASNKEDNVTLSQRYTQAEGLEKELAKCRKRHTQLSEAAKAASERVTASEKKIESIRATISAAESLIETIDANILSAVSAVDGLLGTAEWRSNWVENPDNLRKHLDEKANNHTHLIDRQQSLVKQIETTHTTITNISGTMDAIVALRPVWGDIDAHPAPIPHNAMAVASEILAALQSATDRLNTAVDTIAAATAIIAEYRATHPDITEEVLATIDGVTPEALAEMRATVSGRREAVTRARAIYDGLHARRTDHDATRPEIAEEDTVESLAETAERLNKLTDGYTESIATTVALLDTDRKNRERVQDLIEEESRRQAEFRDWQRLNTLFGDATGNKFRKIAQSFILANLVHSANRYMNTLSGRYTLSVEPGTFIINIEDAYQGYARRAASTLSGGESFLVSLALALALSDIDQRLTMDTLFIDEGFGSLSGEPLRQSLDTLRSLQSHAGRRVGIISHIEALRERIPVQVQVKTDPRSSVSRVTICTL